MGWVWHVAVDRETYHVREFTEPGIDAPESTELRNESST
jgi:hypothetical protein